MPRRTAFANVRVWAKSSHFETPLRIQLPQAIKRGCGHQMYERTVKECTFRERKVGDGVPVIESLNIRPVFFSCRGLYVGQRRQFHVTI